MSRAVAVTGAAGFLGAAVVRRLLARGHRVLAWVRPTTDLARLSPALGQGPLTLLRLDTGALRDPGGRAEAARALRGFGAEVLVHAAWRGVRGPARDEPAQVDEVAATLDVLRAGAEAGVRRFVGLGSQAEYGPQAGVITEETVPTPATLYGSAKLAAGQLSLALAPRLGVSAAWARAFSIYGPGERPGTLVPDLASALREGRPFPLGRGDVRWDFLFEDDAGDAIEALAAQDGAVGTFNVASGAAVPLEEVFTRVRDLAAPGAPLAVGARPRSPADLPRLEASIARLREATGWAPLIGLDDGLARTIAAMMKGPGAARNAG
jgi:UDP-glucose 4-epimerase